MWKETIKIKLKCPKHPRFNPRRGGRSSIKAGCGFCQQIAGTQEKLDSFGAELDKVEQNIDEFEDWMKR